MNSDTWAELISFYHFACHVSVLFWWPAGVTVSFSPRLSSGCDAAPVWDHRQRPASWKHAVSDGLSGICDFEQQHRVTLAFQGKILTSLYRIVQI